MALFGSTKRVEELEQEIESLKATIEHYKANYVLISDAKRAIHQIEMKTRNGIHDVEGERDKLLFENEDLKKRISNLEDAVIRWKWKYERDIEEREQTQSLLVRSKDYDGDFLKWDVHLPFPQESPSWHVHRLVKANKLKYAGYIFVWFKGKKLDSYIEANEIFSHNDINLVRVFLRGGKWFAQFNAPMNNYQIEQIENRLRENGYLTK